LSKKMIEVFDLKTNKGKGVECECGSFLFEKQKNNKIVCARCRDDSCRLYIRK